MKYGDFLRGMSAGLIAGTAIGFAMMPKKKPAKAKGPVSRMIKSVGDAMNDISNAMGF